MQPNASLRAFKKSIGIRTNEVRLYDIGISCIALLSVWLYTMMINSLYISRFVLLAKRESIVEGGNLAASKIRNLECPNYEICLIDYGCGKFNRKIHIMEQYP